MSLRMGTSQPASNLGPLSPRQQKAIPMAFRWRAESGPNVMLTGILTRTLTALSLEVDSNLA